MKLYLAEQELDGTVNTLNVEFEEAKNHSQIVRKVVIENDLKKAFYIDPNDYEFDEDYESDKDYTMAVVNQWSYGIRQLIWQEF